MKIFNKYLIYLLMFILIIFVLPAICTKRKNIKAEEQKDTLNKKSENKVGDISYDYSKYGTIKSYVRVPQLI